MPHTSNYSAGDLQRMLVWGFCLFFFSAMIAMVGLAAASNTEDLVPLLYVCLVVGTVGFTVLLYARYQQGRRPH
jgi:undecaprenyl pyrophosphate phosphatase UppP